MSVQQETQQILDEFASECAMERTMDATLNCIKPIIKASQIFICTKTSYKQITPDDISAQISLTMLMHIMSAMTYKTWRLKQMDTKR